MGFAPQALAQAVMVSASIDDTISALKAAQWWHSGDETAHAGVPKILATGITQRWQREAGQLTVADKKEVFYRLMLPLVMLANEQVLALREQVLGIRAQLEPPNQTPLAPDDRALISQLATLLRVTHIEPGLDGEAKSLRRTLDQILHKLDVIPVGLALGQAAYESGYGTSRFAIEGNALFGQWTYGGQGLLPEQQREHLGDHRIAAYDWPFDSVRGYFINLMSHPAYETFRALRAQRRAAGLPLDSLSLADGLTRYSERGEAYVDTLKGIIRVNRLDRADNAVFRDEPVRFLVGAEDTQDKQRIEIELESLRESGELAKIIERMRLN